MEVHVDASEKYHSLLSRNSDYRGFSRTKPQSLGMNVSSTQRSKIKEGSRTTLIFYPVHAPFQTMTQLLIIFCQGSSGGFGLQQKSKSLPMHLLPSYPPTPSFLLIWLITPPPPPIYKLQDSSCTSACTYSKKEKLVGLKNFDHSKSSFVPLPLMPEDPF